MAAQGTTTLTSAMQTYYEKQALETEQETIILLPWMDKKGLPGGSGKTIQFYSYRPLETIDPTTGYLNYSAEPMAAYTLGSPSHAVKIRNVSATIKTWGATVEFSELLSLTAIDENLKGVNKLMAMQAANTIDLDLYYNIVKSGATGWMAGATAWSTTVGGVGKGVCSAAGATTSIHPPTAALLAGTYGTLYTGAMVSCYKYNGTSQTGGNYGWAGRVDAVTTGTDGAAVTLTVSPAAPAAFTTNDWIRIATLTGITSSALVTTATIANAYGILLANKPTVGDAMFKGLLCPQTQSDLLQDTTWVSAHSYSDIESMKKRKLKDWFGVTWYWTSQPVRESVTGAWTLATNDTAAVYHNLIIAPHAMGALKLGNAGGYKFNILNQPEKADPYNERIIMVWKQRHVSVPLNGNWIVDIASGTASNI